MIQAIKNIKGTVRTIMCQEPKTREDDHLLILKVWAKQNPELRDKNMSFVAFSRGFLQGNYANPESIRRVRQKIQETDPELRGRNYGKRQKKEVETRKEIHSV